MTIPITGKPTCAVGGAFLGLFFPNTNDITIIIATNSPICLAVKYSDI